MATLFLTAAGSAIGDFIAGPIGASIGQAAGALGGALLQPGTSRTRLHIGPRLTKIAGVTSMEGAPVPTVYGRARVGGQMIWASRFLEQTSVGAISGFSGGGKAAAPAQPTTIDVAYTYYANFAIGLCEGPIAFVRRVWADGQELDLTTVTMRVYRGDEAQEADPLIAAVEQTGTVPAYRGLAYVVFDRLPLAKFGNRVPQLSFEVVRPVDGVAHMVRAVDIIPGATEFGYQPTVHASFPALGSTVYENRNQSWAATDWQGSIDALQALCPNLKSVALVVAWFGDDLRAGQCTIAPRVDNAFKTLSYPFFPVIVPDWSVAGLARAGARLVSRIDGASAYGGTPSDDGVVAAIADLRARGLSVTFYPFVMMDIASGNALTDPWTGNASQPAFPWRGHLVCDPAPGRAGTVDGSAAAAAQVAQFFGTASPPASEWSYRRFILHCAALCQQAGGVDAFLVGSELVGLTRVRSASGVYPAAQALAQLAADVKATLGPTTKVSYSADWTEYGAHVLDGGAEVRFPLDLVWGSASVDFVGVDAYWPLSDWRDGAHLDQAAADAIYDLSYLIGRIGAGEAYDWYYADQSARDTQTRTPIADGAYGKPWTFRQKDIVGWWSNAHLERVGGVELSAPTAWIAQGKPIWLMETGCPAVDRGANAPNVFPDPKSGDGGRPYYSRGFRDDLMQARFIEAMLTRFDPAQAGFVDAWNPTSTIYGGRMVDPSRIHLWCWDARPFPAFPDLGLLWSDAPNWETGHWLNGRLEGTPADRLVTTLTAPAIPANVAAPRPDVVGFCDGYVLDRAMSARAAVEPLADAFAFDPIVSGGAIRFERRSRAAVLSIGPDDIVPDRNGALVRLTRAQESELPHEMALTFGDADNAYATATVLSRRIEGWSMRRTETESAILTNRASAQQLADIWLEDLWSARETAEFDLPPSAAALEPGDIVALDAGFGARNFLVTSIADGPTRTVTARTVDPSVYDRVAPVYVRRIQPTPRTPGPPHVLVLDLAVAPDQPTTTQYIAACADPWPGALAVYRNLGFAFEPLLTLRACATIGRTLDTLAAGPVARFDRGSSVTVKLFAGQLAAVGDALALQGRSSMAIQGPDGAWEIFAFSDTQLVAENTYILSRLVRGLGGEEALAARSVPPGAPIVLLDGAVMPLTSGLASIGAQNNLSVGPASDVAGGATYASVVATVTPKVYKPYAPVQARAVRTADGVAISFVRRGRIESDAWEPIDIPLGEDSESYQVAIARPAGDARVIQSASQSLIYANADMAADFPTPPASLDLTVQQMSASVGAGFPLSLTVPIQ
ncbi:MAG: glycoside hydrolase/phage tail family protein [Hyphomicrobiales bacterium]|nr:glycoside hydrolase/phage tail family protein [Hyphomicrobiales bacterium]